jgi:hypothetical protein
MALRICTKPDTTFHNERVGCAARTITNVDIDRSFTFPCHFDWSKSLETRLVVNKQQTSFIARAFAERRSLGHKTSQLLSGVISQGVRCLHFAQLMLDSKKCTRLVSSECAPVGMTNGVQWKSLGSVGIRTRQERVGCAWRTKIRFEINEALLQISRLWCVERTLQDG